MQESGSTLTAVQDAGVFRCGTRDDLPGFATLDADGEHVGFDSDFCRVIAAAVLGDATAVEMVDLETADRFTALQSGEVDALVRNTTWTASRDGGEGATFMQPNYYDGQGMMVAADSGFASLADMDGVIVCVAQGTTTEGNAAAEAARLGVTWEVRPFEDVDLIQEAFIAGQCDGWSSDTSQLVGLRSTYPEGPDALTILPEVFSKEPLAPAVADGDSEWAQAVNWAILATITGRGARDHLRERRHLRRHRRHQHPAVPRPDRRWMTPSSIPASACRRTTPSRSSARWATTERSSRSTSLRWVSIGASTRSGQTAV